MKLNSQTSQRREDITSKPIANQLVKLTIPMLYALVAIMSLGLADSYFISYLGTDQLAAIGFIIPITSVVTSLGLGLGMAISSLTSKLIGANKLSSASRLITDGFYLTGLIALLAVLILVLQLEAIFMSIGANSVTMPLISNYMLIWMFAVPLVMYTMVCASTFRSLGDTASSAQIAISMTLLNIILDPVLIFGLGPFPEMGMRGAALATVIAVVVSCSIGFYKLGVKEKLLLWALPRYLEFKSDLKQLLEIAIPAVLANAIVPITAAVLTTLVAKFGSGAVAGYGVGVRVEAVSLMIVYAMSSTLPMFIGQNLGANKPERAFAAIKLSFRFVMFLQFGIFLILIVAANPIAQLFSSDAAVIETITTYLWIAPLSYGLCGVVILINVSMNVLGKPRLALYINILRLMLFYLPLAYLGAHWYGLTGLFVGIALGNCCAYYLANFFLKQTLNEMEIKSVAN